MDTMKIVFTVLHIIVCVLLVAVVLMQEGKDPGMKSISGSAPETDSFFGRNAGRTKAAIFSKFTVALAVLFLITTVVLVML